MIFRTKWGSFLGKVGAIVFSVGAAATLLFPSFGISLMAIGAALSLPYDIYQIATGKIQLIDNGNGIQINNSSTINSPLVIFGYSIYMKYFSDQKDKFTGTAGGIAAEWIGHNIAYTLLSITSIFGFGKDKLESAKNADIGSIIYSETRNAYRIAFLFIEAFISPLSFWIDFF